VTPWVALLGVCLGLMILSGAVEPIFDGGIVLVLYAIWLARRTTGPRRLHVVVGAVTAVVLGLVLGAAQLIPGAAFQAQSQRAMHSYLYFASGSMNKSLTILGLDPLLLGGAHQWPLSFIGTFNLPEISSYIGILPVMGLLGLLARRHRRSSEAGQWWIWYVILVVGLFLTWGGFTPVAHLFYDIPLFNRQRLLSRNLLEVDLALAVIFAFWVDRMFTPAIDAAAVANAAVANAAVEPAAVEPAAAQTAAFDTPTGRRHGGRRRWTSDVVLPLVPPMAVVGLQVTLLAGGPWFPRLLHVPDAVTRATLAPLILVLTVPSLVAVSAAGLVIGRRRLGRRLPALLIAVLVVDLAVFNAGIQGTPDPHDASAASSATANRLPALVRAQGEGPAGEEHRVAMFDPDGFYPVESNRIGQPDLTMLRSLDSVQGYGAVVNERYDAETGTHLQLNLTPSALSGDKFDPLDLGLLVAPPEYFVHLVSRPPGFTGNITNGAVPLPPVAPDRSAPPDRSRPGPTPSADYVFVSPPSPTATLTDGYPRTQYFGTVLSVTTVTVPIPMPGQGALRIGLVSADGRTTSWLGPPVAVAGASDIVATSHRGPRRASGIVLLLMPTTAITRSAAPPATATAATVAPVAVGAAVVRTAGQGTYRVDGSLRDIVTAPGWRFVGTDGVFGVFSEPGALGRAWVTGDRSATARVVTDTAWGAETIRVDTGRPATLVRSVQYTSGWQATITSVARGRSRNVASQSAEVRRLGLVQSVTVPAGIHLVRFAYRPADAYEGLALSAVGVMAVLVLAVWPWSTRRRRARLGPNADRSRTTSGG
jgi:hypothetical protein